MNLFDFLESNELLLPLSILNEIKKGFSKFWTYFKNIIMILNVFGHFNLFNTIYNFRGVIFLNKGLYFLL